MQQFIGTRAEREWLATFRGIRQELRRFNEQREAWDEVVEIIEKKLDESEKDLLGPDLDSQGRIYLEAYRAALTEVGRELEQERDRRSRDFSSREGKEMPLTEKRRRDVRDYLYELRCDMPEERGKPIEDEKEARAIASAYLDEVEHYEDDPEDLDLDEVVAEFLLAPNLFRRTRRRRDYESERGRSRRDDTAVYKMGATSDREVGSLR